MRIKHGYPQVRFSCCAVLFALVVSTFSGGFCVAGDAAKPNIVFFLVDDLGWRDVACFGSPLHLTPHIDSLARDGIRFDQAYAAACTCSPTRASIMTGKYPARLRMTSIIENILAIVRPMMLRFYHRPLAHTFRRKKSPLPRL